MRPRRRLLPPVVCAVVAALLARPAAAEEDMAQCGGVQRYTFRFAMKWTEKVDRDIPEKAAFSRVVGVAHVDEFRVFQPVTMVKAGMRSFIKDGKTELLEKKFEEGKKNDEVSDWAIEGKKSNGPTDTVDVQLSFDGAINATWVTILARLEPSPGWVVGSAPFNLCNEKERVFMANNSEHDTLVGFNSGLSSGKKYEDPFKSLPLGEQEEVSRIRDIRVASYGSLTFSPNGKIQPAKKSTTASGSDGGGFRIKSWYGILVLCVLAVVAAVAVLLALQRLRKKSVVSMPIGPIEEVEEGRVEGGEIDW